MRVALGEREFGCGVAVAEAVAEAAEAVVEAVDESLSGAASCRLVIMIFCPDSTTPVLGTANCPEDSISLMIPERRRQAAVFPIREAPRKMTLMNQMSTHWRDSRTSR